MNVQRKEKGFTIIEVVLVLAIAGLIFLMVFIALPALQRNQRDAARKSEVGTVASAITTYQSNNRGQSPSDDASTFGSYLDSTITTQGGVITLASGTTVTKYTGSVASGTTGTAITAATQDNIVFVVGSKCDTDNKVVKGTSRQAAVLVQLESGNGAYYCQTD